MTTIPQFDRDVALATPTKDLLDVHNALVALVPGTTVLASWKRSKVDLVDRVEDMCRRAHEATAKVEDLDELIADVAEMSQEDFELGMAQLEAERADTTDPTMPMGENGNELVDDLEQFKQQLRDKGVEVVEDVAPEPTGARTIRAAAIDLLCRVEYHEDRNKKSDPTNRVEASVPGARSVGLAYDDIIQAIKAEFPDANTSVACLRWYSVKIRVEEHGYEGLRLPQRRPRAKPRTGV